jgi:DtxR family Mn-dependent transcriptional regulator
MKNNYYKNDIPQQHVQVRAHQIDEILERIWLFEEDHPGKHCTMNDMKSMKIEKEDIEEMVADHLISVENGEIMLNDKGQNRAHRIIRAHRLAECLLSEAFSFSDETIEKHACSFEHVLCQPVVDSVCTLLGHPKYCPHGKRIIPGKCCQAKENNIKPFVFPLTDLDIEEQGKIVSIFTSKVQRLDFLTSIGIHPGTAFFLERKKPVYVLKVGESRFALEEDVARVILVRRL